MTGAYVNHEDIRQLLANLGKVELPDRRYIIWALEHVGKCIGLPFSVLHFRCKASGPRSEVGIPMTSETLFALGEAVMANDFTRLRNTERLDLVARAFGWKPDAFMHQLKSTTSGLGRNETLSLDYEALPALTIRSLDSGPSVWTMLDALERHSDGLFLFSGPTGSGKSTTLQMTLAEISPRRSVTILEPEVGSFAVSDEQLERLSHSLRRSPTDILALPQIRDERMARVALKMAPSMVVVATIYGESPISSVKTLGELAPDVPADGLRGVFSQRLVRSAEGHARPRLPVCAYLPFNWGEAGAATLAVLPIDHKHGLYTDAAAKIALGATTIENTCAVFGDEFAAFLSSQRGSNLAKTTVVREIPHKDLIPFGKLKFSAEWPVEDVVTTSQSEQ